MPRPLQVALLVGMLTLTFSGKADAQGNGNGNGRGGGSAVDGGGTPGTVPLFTGSGRTLTNSHILDDGASVKVTLPVLVSSGSDNLHGIAGSPSSESRAGVSGHGVTLGVIGGAAGDGTPISGCCITGVLGNANNQLNPDVFAIGVDVSQHAERGGHSRAESGRGHWCSS